MHTSIFSPESRQRPLRATQATPKHSSRRAREGRFTLTPSFGNSAPIKPEDTALINAARHVDQPECNLHFRPPNRSWPASQPPSGKALATIAGHRAFDVSHCARLLQNSRAEKTLENQRNSMCCQYVTSSSSHCPCNIACFRPFQRRPPLYRPKPLV